MSQEALLLWVVSVESVKTLSKTPRWTIFSTSANLHPQCRVTAQQQQLFSFDCKSAQKRVRRLRKRRQPPGYQRLFVWGAHQSGIFNIYFTSCIIINDHNLLFEMTQVQEWGNRVCCSLSDRVCVCVFRFQNRAESAGGRGFAARASALNTADQWITRVKTAKKVQPVTGRTVDPSARSYLLLPGPWIHPHAPSSRPKPADSPLQPGRKRLLGKAPPLVL